VAHQFHDNSVAVITVGWPGTAAGGNTGCGWFQQWDHKWLWFLLVCVVYGECFLNQGS
jgi:hypothetical protein